MPDLKITQFTAIVTVDNTDVLPIVDLSDNTTKKVTVSQVRALAPVQSLTTTGTTGPSTLVAGVLNVPQYATAPAGTDGQVQYNNGGAFGGGVGLIWDDILNYLGIGQVTPTKKLEVFSGIDQTVALFDNDTVGSVIAFKDGLTTDDTRVGVGALADLLILRGNGNATGTVQIGLQFADFQSNELRNFIPRDQTTAINLTIDATNFADYNSAVLEVTGALTITIDGGVSNRFNMSVIQMDANSTTFVGAGGVTLRNRQGHTKTFGQWSTVTLYVTGNDLILAGDTAP
jgi:hypothetical protein